MAKEKVEGCEGVIFTTTDGWGRKTITDIDVEPGVKEVVFKATKTMGFPIINLRGINKQFPDVEKLTLDCVYDFNVSNTMFPNVRKVETKMNTFDANGSVLYEFNNGMKKLLNVFSAGDVEIDMEDVNIVEDFALEGINVTKFLNIRNRVTFKKKAFCGSLTKYQKPVNGIVCVDGVVVDVDTDDDEAIIPDTVVGVNEAISFGETSAVFSNIKNIDIFPNLPNKVIIRNSDHITFSDLDCALHFFSRFGYIEWSDNKLFKSIDGILYTADGKTIIKCPGKMTGRIVIPDGVYKIAKNAFSGSDISSVEIPDSVKIIQEYAFSGCRELSEISIGSGLREISEYAFAYADKLKKLDIPETIERIDKMAFYRCEIEELILHDGLRSIGECAFTSMDLKEVSIPETVEKIGNTNFIQAKRVNVRGYLPDGLLESVVVRNSGFDKHTIPDFFYLTINGREILMPRHMSSYDVDSIQKNLEYLHVEDMDDDYLDNVYKNTHFKEELQDLYIIVYKKTHDEEIKKYLRKYGKTIMKRLFLSGDFDNLTTLMGFNIMTAGTLKYLKDIINEYNNPTLYAYVLKAIDECENKRNTTFKL